MEISSFKRIKKEIKHWYLLTIVGLLFIALGIWVFMTPLSSYLALAILFSVSFLVSGISEIIFSISNRKELNSWGWKFALGLLTTIVGMILVASPLLTIVTLPLYVGFAVLFRSIMAISFSIELSSYGSKQWGWLLFFGILGLLFSYILIWNPLFAGLTVVYWTGLALIMLGIFSIYFSIQLKQLGKDKDAVV
jgi:uncharacterized membrane protein HdeD (DUF308 family)